VTLCARPEATCKVCAKPFIRFRTTQSVCGPRCAASSVKADKRKDREDTRARRLALKSRSEWLDEVQKAVNAYVRERDKGLPCISCETPWEPTFQAGHFRSRGACPELRFDLDNIHGQCVRCNMHLSGNLLGYRAGLFERKGPAVIERLEGPQHIAKLPIDELRTLKAAFRLLTKQLKEKH
jgi:hypothetical protein